MQFAAELKRRLEETHGSLFELHRHYARDLFQNDLITSPDDLRRVTITCLAGVASVGFMIPKIYYKKYEYLAFDAPFDLFRRAIYADMLFFIAFTMLMVAAVVVFLWDSLFPDRRDQNILRPLPLKLRQIYAAKLSTLTGFVVLLVLLLSIPCASSFATVIGGTNHIASSWREIFAHVTAALCAGLGALFSLTLLQSVLVLVVPGRFSRYLSSSLQSLLLAGLLVALPWITDIPNFIESIDARPQWTHFAPPIWFFSLYIRLIGRADAVDSALAVRALAFLVTIIAATVVFTLTFYRRHSAHIMIEGGLHKLHLYDRAVEWIGNKLSRGPRALAFFTFAMKSMHRSHQHELIRLVYAGVGSALMLESALGVLMSNALHTTRGLRSGALAATLALPIALFFFLFSGLRYIFRLPIEIHANWLFRLTVPDATREREQAVRIIYIGCAVLPAIAATAPFLFLVIPSWRAGFALLFASLLSLLLIEQDLGQTSAIPFACGYLPGKRNILHTGIVYWLTFFLLTSIVAALEEALSRTPVRAVLTLMMMAAAVFRQHEQGHESPISEMIFEETMEPTVATLGLARE